MERAAREAAAGRLKRRDVVEGLFGRLDRFLAVRVNEPLVLERVWGAWKQATAARGGLECPPAPVDDMTRQPIPKPVPKQPYTNERRNSASSKHRERMLAVFGGGGGGADGDSEECMLCEGLSVSCAMCRVRSRKQMRADKAVVN